MDMVFEPMRSGCPGSLVLGMVMGGMRCTPLVAEWSDILFWVAPDVSLWNRCVIRVMVGMLSEHDGPSFMVSDESVSGDL